MTTTVAKKPLSGSVDGMPINLTGTITGETTTIHSTISGTAIYDELFIYVNNTATSFVTVNLEWGPTSNTLEEEIPARANLYPLVLGEFVWGHTAATATDIKMFTSSTSIHVYGHINRITES